MEAYPDRAQIGDDGNNRENSHKVASSVAARVFVASLIVQKFFINLTTCSHFTSSSVLCDGRDACIRPTRAIRMTEAVVTNIAGVEIVRWAASTQDHLENFILEGLGSTRSAGEAI